MVPHLLCHHASLPSSNPSRRMETPARQTLAASLAILAAVLQYGPSSPRKGARMEGIWACLNRRGARPAPICGFEPRHFSLAHRDGLHCTERLGDSENTTGDCWQDESGQAFSVRPCHVLDSSWEALQKVACQQA